MKKINVQRTYKELFDKNDDLQTRLVEAVDNSDNLEIEDIVGKY